jgi:hypothetical protein
MYSMKYDFKRIKIIKKKIKLDTQKVKINFTTDIPSMVQMQL